MDQVLDVFMTDLKILTELNISQPDSKQTCFIVAQWQVMYAHVQCHMCMV